MKIQGGFGDTWCRQGGIGYPPLVVKISNRWYGITDSEYHGGSVCQNCSSFRGIPYGFTPQRFAQPKGYGSNCYGSLIPILRPKVRPRNIQSMGWKQFRDLVKAQYGEPEVISSVS